MFHKSLINLDLKVKSEEQLFDFVGCEVIKQRYATLGYISGLEKREIAYPTGLKFAKIDLALPHVDSNYILQPFIFIARNNIALNLKQMGDSAMMTAKNFLFLGIKDGTKQPELLAKIMAAFQDVSFSEQFLNIKNTNQMYDLMKQKIILSTVKQGK